MRAGDMDRRVTIQERHIVYDSYGAPQETWADLATVWAEVRQEGGREFFSTPGVQSERKVIFRMRWMDGITVLHQVLYAGREHNIHQVRELGRRNGLELHTVTTG